MRGLEPPGAPIIAPGETYQAAKAPKERGAGDLYAVHALEERGVVRWVFLLLFVASTFFQESQRGGVWLLSEWIMGTPILQWAPLCDCWLLLVVMPGATSSVLATSSNALVTSSFLIKNWELDGVGGLEILQESGTFGDVDMKGVG